MSDENQLSRESLATLTLAVKNSRLAHGLLFTGRAEAGIKKATQETAMALFCESTQDERPCRTCVQCQQMLKGQHPDYRAVAPEKDTQGIRVETVRDLIQKASFKPFQARAKVFVIDEAHSMNEVAQNAILKTLEEPLGPTYFILATSRPEGLLETVRSRLQVFRFTDEGRVLLEDPAVQALAEETFSFIVHGIDRAGEWSGREPELLKTERQTLVKIFDFLIASFHEILMIKLKATQGLGPILDKSLKEKLAHFYEEQELSRRIEILAEFKEKIQHNINLKLLLPVCWQKLRATHGG